jgi:hypothetical protein
LRHGVIAVAGYAASKKPREILKFCRDSPSRAAGCRVDAQVAIDGGGRILEARGVEQDMRERW